MARQVQQPQKQRSGLGDLLTIGGAVAGGIAGAGTPQGVMAGAAAGQALGGLAGGVVDPQPQQSAGVTAAQRAMEPQQGAVGVPEVEDPEAAIRQAQIALGNLPKPVQEELGPALLMGQRAYQQKREAQA